MSARARIAILFLTQIGSVSSLAAAAGSGCDTWDEVSRAGLEYLALPHRESGADVVVALEIVAAATASRRAAEVAAIRRDALDDGERETWGALLGVPKPMLGAAAQPSESAVDGAGGSGAAARSPASHEAHADFDPSTTDAADCVKAAVACRWPPPCTRYLESEAHGSDLTHQAAALLLADWAKCPNASDLLVERERLGNELAIEARGDLVVSDLYAERLAMLAHLGFTNEIELVWIERLLAARRSEGCWATAPGGECHPHTTALALWSLALVQAAGRWPCAATGDP